MKPFLGIDKTTDKANEEFNGAEFIIRRPSSALSDSLNTANGRVGDLINRARLPLAVRIVGWICVVAALVIFVGVIRVWGEVEELTFAQMYATAPWLFWIGGAAAIGAVVFAVTAMRFFRRTIESDEGDVTFAALDDVLGSIFTELGVPSDAVEVDLLSFEYKDKDGEPTPYSRWKTLCYTTCVFSAYVRDGQLCLADADGVYAIPLSDLRTVHTVRKTITMDSWNKETPHNKGEYKPYKIREDDEGNYSVKPYHILTLDRGGEEWGIYFPSYELPIIERLTHLTVSTSV